MTAPSTSKSSLTISRRLFEEAIQGRKFKSWEDFAAVVPAEPSSNLMLGALSLALVVIVNVAVWLLIFFAVSTAYSGQRAKRRAGWVAFLLLAVYGFTLNYFCHRWHDAPDVPVRIVSSVFFGIVPATTSTASYILGLLLIDSEAWDKSFKSSAFDTAPARLIGLLAVVPGLLHSLHLFRTLSTSFEAVGITFDVLSLCVFVDVARTGFHVVFLVAPPQLLSTIKGRSYFGATAETRANKHLKDLLEGWALHGVRVRHLKDEVQNE